MPPIKMLALDLDGTLAVDNHQVLPATRAGLKNLHETGVEVVIATGRRYRTTRFVIDNLGFDVYAVCNGGALVKTPNAETHYETTYSTSQLNDIVNIARDMELSLFAQRDAHDRGGPDFVIDDAVPWSGAIRKYFETNSLWNGKDDLLNQAPEFLVSGTFAEEHQLKAFCEKIHQSFPEIYPTIVVPQPDSEYSYCEVTLANINKWYGLSQLASLFNLGVENICAVGDQLNDLPMLKAVGHGITMGNGNDALHKHTKFVCSNHDEDGILEVIEHIRHHNHKFDDQINER